MNLQNGRAIALVDCDSFFASCEQLVNPSLINKPVVVMSNNDGCIVARSKEAKELGVKMGMPVFQAKKLYPNIYYISGNLALYGDISSRVMHVLRSFTPDIEIYSIDEAFLDLTGLRRLYKKSYLEIAEDIKTEVKNKVGVSVSVGISLTKTLAKLATQKAKGNKGFYRIGFRSINDELKKTDLIDIWGLGINTVSLLNKYYLHTAYDFTVQNDSWIDKILGKKGLEIKKELLGTSIYPINTKFEQPKSIQKTSSFSAFTSEPDFIINSLHYHVHRGCKKLRTINLKTETVGIMLRTKTFNVLTVANLLIHPSNWEFEIFPVVDEMFKEIYVPNVLYRSSGIYFSNLKTSKEEQLSIFDSTEHKIANENLAKTWDSLENKYGRDIIYTGSI